MENRRLDNNEEKERYYVRNNLDKKRKRELYVGGIER